MGSAKVEILVVPGKKLTSAQLPLIQRALNGKSFSLAVPDRQLTSAGEIAVKSDASDLILDLLRAKAPALKNALKLIVKSSSFKAVPDDCAVLMDFDGADLGEVKSVVKLAQPKPSDPTKRAGYKPAKDAVDCELDGEAVYAKANLRDMLAITNPGVTVTIRGGGPSLAPEYWTRIEKAADDCLAAMAADIGALADKAAQALEKLLGNGEAEGAEKIVEGLNKGVNGAVLRLQPAVVKALTGLKAMLKSKEPAVGLVQFDCSVVARFIRFTPSPTLDAAIGGSGPSRNDKQVRPLTKERKDMMIPLRQDEGERKAFVKEAEPVLTALAAGNEIKNGPERLQAAAKTFGRHVQELDEASAEMGLLIQKIEKNNKGEKPDPKSPKDDKDDYKQVMLASKKLRQLLLTLGERAAHARSMVLRSDMLASAALKSKLDGGGASALGRELPTVEKQAFNAKELANFKKLSQKVLTYIKD